VKKPRRSTGRGDPYQLQLQLEGPLKTPDQLLDRLRELGLRGITSCRLTRNRAVMVSYSGKQLRVHRAYLGAPPEVLRAIALFVNARTRAERRSAQRVILSFPVHTKVHAPVRRPGRPSGEDSVVLRELAKAHRHYNRHLFGGRLGEIGIRISARMRSRLGQYTAASPYGEPAEIAISRAHLRKHGWEEVLHTLLHEMVHQWQAESGYEIDHGPTFRAKAVEVGIAPHARRELRPAKAGRVVSPHELLLRAARHE
jgi:hypothetical protein